MQLMTRKRRIVTKGAIHRNLMKNAWFKVFLEHQTDGGQHSGHKDNESEGSEFGESRLCWCGTLGTLGKKSKCPQKAGGDVGILSAKPRRVFSFTCSWKPSNNVVVFFFWERSDLCLLKWVEVAICKMGVIFILILEINSLGLFVVQMK